MVHQPLRIPGTTATTSFSYHNIFGRTQSHPDAGWLVSLREGTPARVRAKCFENSHIDPIEAKANPLDFECEIITQRDDITFEFLQYATRPRTPSIHAPRVPPTRWHATIRIIQSSDSGIPMHYYEPIDALVAADGCSGWDCSYCTHDVSKLVPRESVATMEDVTEFVDKWTKVRVVEHA